MNKQSLNGSIVKSTNPVYISPTPGEFPIMTYGAYTIPMSVDDIKKEIFEGIIECGFNVVIVSYGTDKIAKAFDVTKNLSIKLIIGQNDMSNDTMLEEVDKYKSNKYLGAYLLKDEPTYVELESLSELSNSIHNLDAGHISCVNLACDFKGNMEQKLKYLGDIATYQEYLQYIQNLFHPAVWFYDFYPITFSGGKTNANVADFFEYMQMFYDISKQTKRPFWAHCMCMPYLTTCGINNKDDDDVCNPDSAASAGRPVPTVGELRFEAFSALAYGAQGIVYWSYTQRPRNGAEKYFSAPIDLEGKRTDIWYRVQQINQEIKSYSEVFLGCEVVKIAHAGKQYPGTIPFTTSFGIIKSLETQSMGVVVSHVRNNKIDYLIIVNHDPLNVQKIKLEFLNPDSVVQVSDDQYEQPDEYPDDNHYRVLGPGGYLIFSID